jgi:hypothetical protein
MSAAEAHRSLAAAAGVAVARLSLSRTHTHSHLVKFSPTPPSAREVSACLQDLGVAATPMMVLELPLSLRLLLHCRSVWLLLTPA